MIDTKPIVGRYAPSPTGDLHLGNLRTALVAWLHARLQNGRFLLRMEDIDTTRVVKGSAEQILHDLEWLGLDWDGEVVYQSQRLDLYRDAMSVLETKGLVYPCFCSRRDVREAAQAPHGGEVIYPGTCRVLDAVQIEQQRLLKPPAYRIKVSAELADQCGDFILKRADHLYAYQLVVVVDDLDQQVTQVVRGADLINSTARQQFLANQLNEDSSVVSYWHAPLMLDKQGERMAKRDGSLSIAAWQHETKGDADQLVTFLLQSLGLKSLGPSSTDNLTAEQALDEISINELNKVFVEC